MIHALIRIFVKKMMKIKVPRFEPRGSVRGYIRVVGVATAQGARVRPLSAARRGRR
jgi:hypothetical protein